MNSCKLAEPIFRILPISALFSWTHPSRCDILVTEMEDFHGQKTIHRGTTTITSPKPLHLQCYWDKDHSYQRVQGALHDRIQSRWISKKDSGRSWFWHKHHRRAAHIEHFPAYPYRIQKVWGIPWRLWSSERISQPWCALRCCQAGMPAITASSLKIRLTVAQIVAHRPIKRNQQYGRRVTKS